MTDGPLRIALVSSGFPPQLGGTELYLARLADGLASLGCEVDVLVQRRHTDAPVPRLQNLGSGARVHWFPSRTRSRRFPVAPSLIRFLRHNRRRYDVIHGHNFHALPGPMAVLLAQGPAVFNAHYHGGGHTPAARALHRVYRPIGARATRTATALIANSDFEAELVSAHFCVPRDSITVLYPGVDLDNILAAAPYDTSSPVILTGGRLENYKQVNLAISALPFLPTQAQLCVLGEGPRLSDLRAAGHHVGGSGASYVPRKAGHHQRSPLATHSFGLPDALTPRIVRAGPAGKPRRRCPSRGHGHTGLSGDKPDSPSPYGLSPGPAGPGAGRRGHPRSA